MNINQSLKNKGWDRNTIITCVIILLLCVTMFYVGKATAYKEAVEYANEEMQNILTIEKSVSPAMFFDVNISDLEFTVEDVKNG